MRLGVVGAGTMGAGIARLGEAAGMEPVVYDPLLEDTTLDALSVCDLIIEAVPEDPEVKRELFGALSVIAPAAVLATNTSSIPVTSLAGATANPSLVVGMHFFNPPEKMRLVEVIAADQSAERALARAREAGEAMGKHVIDAADGPGFLVNRCGRPFGAEALRLVQERVATPEQVDRICRLGGGFRMGPFELMDLVGIDVGLAVAESFTALSYGEPRWKPNPLQARMVAAGRLGRKTGRGWYEYPEGGRHRPKDPEPPEGGEQFDAAGLSHHRLPGAGLVEFADDVDRDQAQRRAEAAGLHCEFVAEAPGMVLGRIVCCLVNEAAFAIGEGVGSAQDVDVGMKLGLNHPRGPVEWGEAIGLPRVLATIDALWESRREERYRAAPLLRRAVERGSGLP